MKIGFVFDDTLDTADGIQQYLQTNGAWLRAEGHEVHYLVGETKRQDIENVHSLSRNVKVRFNQNRLSIPLPANKAAIKTLLNKEKFDVLHVQMPYSPWLAGRIIAAAPATSAIVGTFHIMPASSFQSLATKLLGAVERRTLKKFDEIVSVSQPAQKFAAEALKIRSSVLPNTVNFSALGKGKKLKKFDDGKTNIITIGRLVERKGARYLIEAYAKLNPANCRLIICGKGPLLRSLQELANKLGVNQSGVFEGFIAEEDKAHYLASADLAVYPSTGGESFGIVLIEAVAAGARVVLAGDNPGYRSVMGGETKAMFDPQNIDDFAKLLDSYISNKAARNNLNKWQQEHFKQFDVTVVAPRLVELYARAMHAKRKVR